MKRFVVNVLCGYQCIYGEEHYEYKHYDFDTYSEARKFAAKFPKDQRYIEDLARLPF